MKLGEALARRDLAPHIYESAGEAREHLAELEHPGKAGESRPAAS
jgi:hypothetical protein